MTKVCAVWGLPSSHVLACMNASCEGFTLLSSAFWLESTLFLLTYLSLAQEVYSFISLPRPYRVRPHLWARHLRMQSLWPPECNQKSLLVGAGDVQMSDRQGHPGMPQNITANV